MFSSELDLNRLGVNLNSDIQQLLSLKPGKLPLSNYTIYSGNSPALASKLISTIAEPREFKPLVNSDDLHLEICRARLAKSQIGITFNSDPVKLVTPNPISHYSFMIPLNGNVIYSTQQGDFEISAPNAFFLSANSHLNIERSKNHLAIVLALGITGFESFLGDEIELLASPERPYSLKFDMGAESFKFFGSILGTLLEILDGPADHQSHQDLVISRLEEALWYQFFIACPEIYNEHLKSQNDVSAPTAVQRVVDHIRENLDKELSMSELVDVAGASLRSLHASFSESFGYGPMAFVRKSKLAKCREQLADADPSSVSVTDIASKWGFFHLSNFARHYKQEYGELPSETLKRHKNSE